MVTRGDRIFIFLRRAIAFFLIKKGDRFFMVEQGRGNHPSTHHIPTKILENLSRMLWCLVNFRVDVVFGE
jgi:hypothetical protein